MVEDVKGAIVLRRAGLLAQDHSSFFGGPAGLPPVTWDAGADNIFPGMLAATETGYDVVERELFHVFATVLTGEIVAAEDFQPGYLAVVAPGTPYHRLDLYNRGDGKKTVGGADESGTILKHLGLILLNKYYSPAYPTDIKRLVGKIQYQYREINHHNLLPHSTRKFHSSANSPACTLKRTEGIELNTAIYSTQGTLDLQVFPYAAGCSFLTAYIATVVRSSNVEQEAYLGVDQP